MESTFLLDSQVSLCVLLQPKMLEKYCFLCNVKENDGKRLEDSQESSLLLCKVFNVPHLMNDLKILENIKYCHPCKKRILKMDESLEILKKLEKEVLEEKHLIELQLEANYKVMGNELHYSPWDFGVELVNEMRFKSIKSKLNKVVKNQIERKFYSKTKDYRIMKNIRFTEKLKHGTFNRHISKELTTPLMCNIISTEKRPFINDNLSLPSNSQFIDPATNSPFSQAEISLTSHVYDFDEIKLELLGGETNDPTDVKDPLEGIVPESGFVTEYSTTQKTFICGVCETNFEDYNQLDKHCRTHHTVEKPFKCSYCEKLFSRPQLVKIHERIHTGEKPEKCRYCEKTFRDPSNLKQHEYIHKDEKHFKCRYCDKTFRGYKNRKSHERIHRPVKAFNCKFCEKNFSKKSSMEVHELIHTDEKPFKCGYCDKAFRYFKYMKAHEAIHNTLKPFKCKFCEKYFTRKSSRGVHERIHTDERPFKCGYCEKTFRYSNSIKSHERIHTGEKPFKCSYCDKTFGDRSYMNIHEHIHKDEKPFKCGYCDKTFRHRKFMKSHERIHKTVKPL